jgi:hypothetical protein
MFLQEWVEKLQEKGLIGEEEDDMPVSEGNLEEILNALE